MKWESCNIPFTIGKSKNDAQVIELFSYQQPDYPMVLWKKTEADEVVTELFEENMQQAAKKAAKEAEAGANLLRQQIASLTGEMPITLAAKLGIRIDALRTNWDLWASATEKINGIFVYDSFRIARISPSDIRNILLRRTFTKEQLEFLLESALDAASGSHYAVRVQQAKSALNHGVTTDKFGLAMDFNPTEEMLREAAYRDLRETLEDDLITETMVVDHMMFLEEKMHDYLFGGGPESGTTLIRMTGARSKDEIAAVRAMARAAEIRGDKDWVGIASGATDAEISNVIKKLKETGFVFHHSGKVDLDIQGYPLVEMQLIETEAHRKMLTSYEGIDPSDVDLWQVALGQPHRIDTVVEQLLQHVGGCKVFTVFYGIRTYK
mgnify:CR=1 FL=1